MASKTCDFFSNVKETKIEWLWYPYIPYGKLTVLQGDPGDGKSTFILNIAALLTRGKAMPDGYVIKEAQSVIYQCAEDNPADTIKPRLLAAGADCERVAFICDAESRLTIEDPRIEEAIRETGARMLILDPLQSFISMDSDMHNASHMRSALGKLAIIAERYQCAIVLVGHMNKATGGKNLYRSLGSIDIVAIARSVLMIERDDDIPEIRYMYPIKSSLAKEGNGIRFRFTANGIDWNVYGKLESSPKLLERKSSKRDQCVSILVGLLKNGSRKSVEIENLISAKGISKRTIGTVKKELGIISYRKNGIWYWNLPEGEMEDG